MKITIDETTVYDLETLAIALRYAAMERPDGILLMLAQVIELATRVAEKP